MKKNVISRMSGFYLRFALVLFLVSLTSLYSCEKGEPDENGTSDRLKVATYNIEYDNKSNWAGRKALVGELFSRYNFDLVGVQEPFSRQITDIMGLLPEYAYFGSNVLGKTNDGVLSNLIIYKRSRFEVLDSGKFWYSETPEISSKGWDAGQYRICVWVKFKDKRTGKEFYHFNSHFDNTGVVAREESAKLLLSRIKAVAQDYPVIATGDFNASQSSEAYRILSSSVFCGDSYKWSLQKDNSNWGTYNNYVYSASPGSSTRIDHLFFSPNNSTISYWKVANDAFSGKYPSDHFPVVAYWVMSK